MTSGTFGTDGQMNRAFSPRNLLDEVPGPLAQAVMRPRRWRCRAEKRPNFRRRFAPLTGWKARATTDNNSEMHPACSAGQRAAGALMTGAPAPWVLPCSIGSYAADARRIPNPILLSIASSWGFCRNPTADNWHLQPSCVEFTVAKPSGRTHGPQRCHSAMNAKAKDQYRGGGRPVGSHLAGARGFGGR